MKLYPFFILFSILFLAYSMIDSQEHFSAQYPSIPHFLSQPQQYHGYEVERTGTIKDITSEGFVLSRGSIELPVKTTKPIRETKSGFASVHGRLNQEGYLELIEIHYHDFQFYKYVTSAVAVIFFLFLFFRQWKITKRGFSPHA